MAKMEIHVLCDSDSGEPLRASFRLSDSIRMAENFNNAIGEDYIKVVTIPVGFAIEEDEDSFSNVLKSLKQSVNNKGTYDERKYNNRNCIQKSS